MAVISSLTNKPLPADMVIFGEIGLSGEIRAVSQPSLRLKEAGKLGFASAITPPTHSKDCLLYTSYQEEIADARKSWNFDCQVFDSEQSDEGKILVITKLSKIKGVK